MAGWEEQRQISDWLQKFGVDDECSIRYAYRIRVTLGCKPETLLSIVRHAQMLLQKEQLQVQPLQCAQDVLRPPPTLQTQFVFHHMVNILKQMSMSDSVMVYEQLFPTLTFA